MYAYIHPSCQRPAFLMVDKPQPGRQFLTAKLLDLSLQPKTLEQGCRCESCKEPMFGAGQIEMVVNYIQWKALKIASSSKIAQYSCAEIARYWPEVRFASRLASNNLPKRPPNPRQ